jgi:hypothetical protein
MSNQQPKSADIQIGEGNNAMTIHTTVFINGIPTPTPTPPTPDPKPQPTGSTDPTGCLMIFPTNPNAKVQPFYVDVTKDPTSDTYACTYGSDTVKFQPMTEGKVKFLRNPGHVQTYASGQPPGKSCRFHITPDGGVFGVGKHSWKDKPLPEFLYSDKCFRSFELTTIFRVGKALGTHQSCADKMASRPDKPDDSLRSTIEFCYPNDQKAECYVNYNYDHKTYAKVSGVIQHDQRGKVEVGKWIGTKTIFIIAADKKSTWIGGYMNTDPIDTATGQIKNDGWFFKAEYLAKGIPEYQNVPPVWGGMTNYRRIDGYETVDLAHHSQREILDSSTLHTANASRLDLSKSKIAEVPKEDFATFDP